MTDGGSSIPEVQRLLAALAVGRRCAEAGTAFGEGAAAMASTARTVVTVEEDPARAAIARDRLRDFDNVDVLVGDWFEELRQRAPFDLLFLDGGGFKQDPGRLGPRAVAILAFGGMLVIDDLTPGRVEHDAARAFLLENDQLAAVEILTTPQTAAIVATRR